VLVELALRQQLATYTQKGSKPRITPADRAFWVFLSQVWSGWKEILVIVQLDTVVRWHRKGFRLYWRSISKRGPGRPPIPVEVQALIRRFANENGWRARKVRAELEKLGIPIGLATVSRYLPKRRPDHDQRQRRTTFLRNHKHGIAAMDFLAVPTLRFRLFGTEDRVRARIRAFRGAGVDVLRLSPEGKTAKEQIANLEYSLDLIRSETE
jgi:hypothetical protein